jgi:hypothetical protein
MRVDDICGVVLDIEVTTGEVNEGQLILERADVAAETTGATPKVVTADAGYAYAKVYDGFEQRGVEALIPCKSEPIRSPVPMRRFRYAEGFRVPSGVRKSLMQEPAGRRR